MEKHEFKPKEWVLVRDDDDDEWSLNVFSHKHGDFFYCIGSAWDQCIPLEGNERLVGTRNSPAEWNVGDIVEVENESDGNWYPGKILLIKKGVMPYFVQSEFGFKESSRLTRCRWCAEEQIRKIGETPEEKPEEEFQFGDKVKCREDGEWMDGLFIMDDHTTVRYLVYLPEENDTIWLREQDVRHA